MLILFVSIFLTFTTALVKPRPQLSRWVIFAIVLYFWGMEELIIQFFSVPYEVLYQKFLVYLLIVFPPVLLMIFCGSKNGFRITAAILLCFLALLLCTRPTYAFARAASGWKLTHFPLRYTENISRLAPEYGDVTVLEQTCSNLTPAARTRLIAHLRRFEVQSGSNPCISFANKRNGPVATFAPGAFQSDQEWMTLYIHANKQRKVEILNRLKEQKNPLLIEQAILNLTTEDDPLILSSVNYLREISGEGIGNDPGRWKKWKEQDRSSIRTKLMKPGKGTLTAGAGFSALEVQADLYDATESGQDFLRVYLTNHFPRKISDSDLQQLQQSVNHMQTGTESQSSFYKRGMFYFFIALAETVRLADENSEDPAKIESHWQLALENFRRSRFLGQGILSELNTILRNADANADGNLGRKELMSIIESRR
jgi:hypothetical protein